MRRGHFSNMDAAGLLRVMWESWNEVYRDTPGHAERSLVSDCGISAIAGRTKSLFPATMLTELLIRPTGS